MGRRVEKRGPQVLEMIVGMSGRFRLIGLMMAAKAFMVEFFCDLVRSKGACCKFEVC